MVKSDERLFVSITECQNVSLWKDRLFPCHVWKHSILLSGGLGLHDISQNISRIKTNLYTVDSFVLFLIKNCFIFFKRRVVYPGEILSFKMKLILWYFWLKIYFSLIHNFLEMCTEDYNFIKHTLQSYYNTGGRTFCKLI